ncbi:MAG: FAD-binding protein [Chlorobiaceae bacterium]|nr:FAD-binding protein [Chlorobiaceae bacterium]
MISTQELIRLIKGPIAVAEPLAPYTGLRIGGTADYFIKPRDRADLCRAFGYFRERGLPFFILGRGSRLLVHEEGFRGTVIATHYLDRIVVDGEMVEADAGASIPAIADRAAKASLGGLGRFGRAAGTVGGALCRIDGSPVKEAGECLEWVDVLRNGRVRRLKNGELHASMGTQGIEADVILGAGFRLHKVSGRNRPAAPGHPPDTGAAHSRALSGRVFRDPAPQSGSGPSSAAELLDACGLRGATRGGASFSDGDPNRILNNGAASSEDVLELVRHASEEVRQRFGVVLELGLVLVRNNRNGTHVPFS